MQSKCVQIPCYRDKNGNIVIMSRAHQYNRVLNRRRNIIHSVIFDIVIPFIMFLAFLMLVIVATFFVFAHLPDDMYPAQDCDITAVYEVADVGRYVNDTIPLPVKNDIDTIKNVSAKSNNDVNSISTVIVSQKPEEPVIEYVIPNRSNIQSFDLTLPSGYTADELNKVLEGTGLEKLGYYYYQAEKQYNVNAVFLIGLSALESGWGTSNLSNTKNNLFGWQAYDNNVSSASYFDTKGDGILYVAKGLSNMYFSEQGRYHRGNTLKDVNYYYASSSTWADNIGYIMCDVYADIEANRN